MSNGIAGPTDWNWCVTSFSLCELPLMSPNNSCTGQHRVWGISMIRVSYMAIQNRSVPSDLRPVTLVDTQQANILVTNDTPPRACLADFGFTTLVFDVDHMLSYDIHMEGGTPSFLSPERIMPSEFGRVDTIPTPESDVFAFGMTIFQVFEHSRKYLPPPLLCPGPYRRTSIPRCSVNGVDGLCGPRDTPGQTRERIGHRVF